jgi:predicted nucleotidyltransferase
VLDEERLVTLAEGIAAVPGIVGVALGGSRARGEHAAESDVDLGLYYRPPLDVQALGALARRVAGPDAEVTVPGEWGPWVDGGAWLVVDRVPVDWIYRDVDRVRAAWRDAKAGRYAFHTQVGHPLGVPDFAYAGELALARVLVDATEELRALQRETANYPPLLADALVAGLWEAQFTVAIARKAVSRRDTAYVAGCLFRAVELCAHALHGRAGRWLVNEKGAVTGAGRLPGAPPDFAVRAHGLLSRLGTQPDSLDAALRAAHDLVDDVRAACG